MSAIQSLNPKLLLPGQTKENTTCRVTHSFIDSELAIYDMAVYRLDVSLAAWTRPILLVDDKTGERRG